MLSEFLVGYSDPLGNSRTHLFGVACSRAPDHDLCDAPGIEKRQRVGDIRSSIRMRLRYAAKMLRLIQDHEADFGLMLPATALGGDATPDQLPRDVYLPSGDSCRRIASFWS